MHDILRTFSDLWIAVYEEVLRHVDVDHWQIWEDISYGKGPMISLPMVREFLCPYIRRVGDFLKAHGVKAVNYGVVGAKGEASCANTIDGSQTDNGCQNAGAVYEPGKCIMCGACVKVAAEAGEDLGLSFIGRGFQVTVAGPFGRPMAEARHSGSRSATNARLCASSMA